MSGPESKPYFKIGEVCELTGTQPYVLRFWESEFPTLAPEKNRSGQRIYRQRDIDLINRIKVLLYEKEYTIAGARKVLESDWEEEGTDGGIEGETASGAATGTPAGRVKKAAKIAHAPEARKGTPPAKSGGEQRASGAAEPDHLFREHPGAGHQLEAEVKNLRAKLAHAEAELRTILTEMERRDGG